MHKLINLRCGGIDMKHAFLSKLQQVILPKLREILAGIKKAIPQKYHKWLLPALALLLVLILCLACCSPGDDAPAEPLLRIVSVHDLDVHKKPDPDSKILGQLPLDLEIEILEQFEIGDTTWGCIDKGWISMEFVDMD